MSRLYLLGALAIFLQLKKWSQLNPRYRTGPTDRVGFLKPCPAEGF
jgi:hypothetical protein